MKKLYNTQIRKIIREEVRKIIKENQVPLMMNDPAVNAKVNMVIKTLEDIEVDGETMQYILDEIGMSEQMLHQLTPGGTR